MKVNWRQMIGMRSTVDGDGVRFRSRVYRGALITFVVSLVLIALVSTISAGTPGVPGDVRLEVGQPVVDQAEEDVAFRVEPSTQTVSVGDTFTATLYVDAGTQSLDSAQAYLDFMPAHLNVLSMTGDGTLETELLSNFNNTLGELGYAAATFASAQSGTFALVTVTFQAMSATSGTPLAFHTTLPRQTKASLLGTPLAMTVAGGTVTILSEMATATPTATTVTPTETATPGPTATPTVIPPASPTAGPYPPPYPGPVTLTPVTGPSILFLPLVYKNAEAVPPGPTPMATSTPWPAECTEGIANGGFEFDSDWFIPATAYSADYSTTQVRTGARSMRMGIDAAGVNKFSYSDARQMVTIPAGVTQATLRFWLYTKSGNPAQLVRPSKPLARRVSEARLAGDAQYLLVLNQSYVWIDTLLWQRRDDRQWMHHQIDVTAFAGRTIRLQFGVYNDGYGGVTAMYLDNVSLELCDGSNSP